MRRRTLLTAILVASTAVTTLVTGCAAPRPTETPVIEGTTPLTVRGGGATLILSGTLTQQTFKLDSMQVLGTRLAGRSSDPDQFRVTLLGVLGQELGVLQMWSPLLRFEWDDVGDKESATVLNSSAVDIAVPATLALESVVLSWPNGQQVARVKVGRAVRKFCLRSPTNPACEPGALLQ